MSITFRVCSDLAEAEKTWKSFCPQETIYDCWEFRATFHKYHKNSIHFIIGELDGICIGAWPLQKQRDSEILEFFGGNYMEDNRLLLSTDAIKNIPTVVADFYEFLNKQPYPLNLECITGSDPITLSLSVQDNKFVLPLAGYSHFRDYVEKNFGGETRRTLNKRVRQIEQEGVTTTSNNLNDIETLFTFNIAMFGEHSSFMDRPFHKEIFRELITVPQWNTQLTTFYVHEKIVAVSFAILYQGSYAYVINGIDPAGIKNFSSYVNLTNIQNAINLEAHSVDAFTGDYGWKERWYFQKIPQYKLIRN